MAQFNTVEGDNTVLLEKGDEGDSDAGYDYDPTVSYRQSRLRWLDIARRTAHWTSHLLLILLLILVFNHSISICPPRPLEKVFVRPEEGKFMDIDRAVQYETKNLQDRDEFGLNPDRSWRGPLTKENMEKWSDVMQLGVVAVDGAERTAIEDALGRELPRSPYTDEWYVVLQAYHDMHCLKIMRETFWSLANGKNASHGLVLHMDHCIDTIRQALMCNADLSPIPIDGTEAGFFNMNRQCRNWDTIQDWAKSRNTTGIMIHAHPLSLPDLDFMP